MSKEKTDNMGNMRARTIGISMQYLNTALSMACGLFLSAFLVRALGDTEYGLYQTICSFVNYLVLLEFGTGTVITRNIAACRAENDRDKIQKSVSTIWVITCILVFVIIIVSIIFYALLGRIYSQTLTAEQIQYGRRIFLVVLGFLVASFYTNTLNGVLLGFEKYKIQPVITTIRLISRTVMLVVIVLIIRRSIVIACVDLIIAVAVDIFLVIYCHKNFQIKFHFKEFDWSIFKNSLPLATAIFIQALVNQANNSVDKFVIGIKLGPEEVTVYSVGLFVYSVFSSMTTLPISMYAPQVVKTITCGQSPDEVSRQLVKPSRLIVLIGGTVLFGFFAVGKQFVAIVYGSSYILAWKVALIIMFPMLINMSNGILINILDATNKRIARSGILLITTIANITLTVLWIDRYGVLGACIATAVCTILGQILLMDLYYYKALHIDIIAFKLNTFKGIVLCQMIAGGIAFVIGHCIAKTVVSLIVGGVAYVCLFSVLFWLFGASADERKTIIIIFQRVRRRKQ